MTRVMKYVLRVRVELLESGLHVIDMLAHAIHLNLVDRLDVSSVDFLMVSHAHVKFSKESFSF